MASQGGKGILGSSQVGSISIIKYVVRAAILLLSVLALTLLLHVSTAMSAVTSNSTYHISDTATGGDCTQIGSWNDFTKTCTLSVDINVNGVDGIAIDSDNITLDGGGHTISGDDTTNTNGVNLWYRSGVVVKNLICHHFQSGIRLNYSYTNDVSYNDASANVIGILLYYSSGNIVARNTIVSNDLYGVSSSQSGNNNIYENTISSNGMIGVRLLASNENDVWANNIGNNGEHGAFISSSSNNELWHNNFDGNAAGAFETGGSGNSYSRSMPAGGNYWSSWTTPDINHDGIVDNSYVTSSGHTDTLPLVSPVQSGKPVLTPDAPNPFWASYADYTDGLLSLTWTVRNNGAYSAFNIFVEGSSDTKGVSMAFASIPMPAWVGSGILAAGDAGSVTLKYNIPDGVQTWNTTLYASAGDGVNTAYTYP